MARTPESTHRRAGVGIPDPHRMVLGGGQQLPTLYPHRAYAADHAAMAFQEAFEVLVAAGPRSAAPYDRWPPEPAVPDPEPYRTRPPYVLGAALQVGFGGAGGRVLA